MFKKRIKCIAVCSCIIATSFLSGCFNDEGIKPQSYNYDESNRHMQSSTSGDEMQPYESGTFKTIDQGNAPTGVAAFYMIFNYFHDQRIYKSRDCESTVALEQVLDMQKRLPNSAQIWKWINNGSNLATLEQLQSAATNLNYYSDYNTCKQYYHTEMNPIFIKSNDSNGPNEKITRLAYITENYLKKNHPVIIHMTPSSSIVLPFHLVLLGYDDINKQVYYACSFNGGYIASAPYDKFINNYFFQEGTFFESRWDGKWLGFYSDQILPGDHLMSFNFGGETRYYTLHVPEKYNSAIPAPLVLDFHGVLMNSQVQMDTSGLREKSEEEGFIVAYPEGQHVINQAIFPDTHFFNSLYLDNIADDVTYSVNVVHDVKKHVNIDSNRVYLSGLSNGGGMALKCAVERRDIFAAVAVTEQDLALKTNEYKNHYYVDPNDPHKQRNIAVLKIHGFDDDIASYYNPNEPNEGTENHTLQWAIENGCNLNPSITYIDNNDITIPEDCNPANNISKCLIEPREKITTYTGCAGGVEVKMYSLHSSGNKWSQPHDIYEYNWHGLTRDQKKKYVADAIWEFLKKYSLPY